MRTIVIIISIVLLYSNITFSQKYKVGIFLSNVISYTKEPYINQTDDLSFSEEKKSVITFGIISKYNIVKHVYGSLRLSYGRKEDLFTTEGIYVDSATDFSIIRIDNSLLYRINASDFLSFYIGCICGISKTMYDRNKTYTFLNSISNEYTEDDNVYIGCIGEIEINILKNTFLNLGITYQTEDKRYKELSYQTVEMGDIYALAHLNRTHPYLAISYFL